MVLVSACAWSLPTCKKKEEPLSAQPNTSQMAPPPALFARPLVPNVSAAALGHVVVPNLSGLLQKARTQLAPPGAAPMLTDDLFKALVDAKLPGRKLVQGINFSAPLGCVSPDVRARVALPLACAFHYAGGAQAFVEAWSRGIQEDSKGHLARIRYKRHLYYVDAAGDAVVWSNASRAFEAAKADLVGLVMHPASDAPDVQLVVHPARMYARFSDVFEAFLTELPRTMSPADESHNEQVYAAYTVASTKQNLRNMQEMEHITFSLHPADEGLAMRSVIHPRAGSDYATRLQAHDTSAAPVASLQQFPSGLLAFGAVNMDMAFGDESLMRELVRLAFAMSADVMGTRAADVERRAQAYLAAQRELYAGPSAWGVLVRGITPALVHVQRLRKGQHDQRWYSFAQAMHAPDHASLVEVTLAPDAVDLGGTTAHRLMARLTTAGQRALEANGPAWFELARHMLGGVEVEALQFEVRGDVVWIASSPDVALGLARAWLHHPDTDMPTTLVARHGEASTVGTVDVGRSLKWIEGLVPANDAADMPRVREGIGKVTFATDFREGSSVAELFVAQSILDDLRLPMPPAANIMPPQRASAAP